MSKPRILVVGSSNTDMILQVDHLPLPGETVLGGRFTMAAGGKGANQAVAAARAGGEVTLVARIGRDAFAEQTIAGFRRDHISTKHIARDRHAPSGVALIFVAKNGANCIAVASGANAALSRRDVHQAKTALAGAQVVLLQLETPLATVQAAAALAAQARIPIILNPAPARPLPDSLLRRIDVLTPNETEAELLTGLALTSDAALVQAAEQLRRRGAGTVIVTLGARGALVATSQGHEFVAGFRVKAVDTTAAGDVFNGALAVALAEGEPLIRAVRFAHAAAAISTTRLGAQPSAPRRREIEALRDRR